jgi:hypothetical protein
MALRWGLPIFLVLDAFFAVGPVFAAAAASQGALHILTRAKKNVVAYRPPPVPRPHRRGRRRVFGRKLKLMKLFDTRSQDFLSVEAVVYQKQETVRYLVLDLIWKPVKGLVRFISHSHFGGGGRSGEGVERAGGRRAARGAGGGWQRQGRE